MSKPNVHIFNVETQEEIIREMNDEEYAQYLIDIEKAQTEEAARQAETDAKEAAKAAINSKLEALGLDLDTIKAISKLTE